MASDIFHSYVIYLSLIICHGYASVQVAQERARVAYYDPKYVENPQAFTFRTRRGDAYRSNFTSTILHSWGNNITLALSCRGKFSGNDMLVKGKLCDVIIAKWAMAYAVKYMHIEPVCPMPAGIYGFYNVELPPKDFPLPLPRGDATIALTYYLEGKKILQYEVKVHIA